MILIYIHNTQNIELLISNVNIFLNKSKILNKYFDIVIYSSQNASITHNLNIIDNSNDFFYKNLEHSNHNYIIEVDDTVNLNIFLSYEFNKHDNNYIISNYNNSISNYFTEDDIKKISKKTITTVKIQTPDSIKIYNLNNLKKISWYNTMHYLHNKCNELHIYINDKKLLILFQLLYPQYIELQKFEEYIEKEPEIIEIKQEKIEVILEELEELEEELVEEQEDINLDKIEEIIREIERKFKNSTVWLIKQSACKKLLNDYVQCLENTYLKKNSIKENKKDPYDKIYVRIGSKFKLSYLQNLNHFYLVEH